MGSFSEQLFRFGRNIVLTRLLAPEVFGTMAIILSAAGIIQSLTEVGVKEALIRNQNGDKDDYIGAAWWLAFGRSALVYLALFVAAPFLSNFYRNLQLTSLLRVAMLGVLFEGALSTRAYVALRQMRFSRWAVINHGGAILGVLTTLVMSIFIRNIWALVLGTCAESAAKCILSYFLYPYFPPLHLSSEAMRDLLHFSKGVFGLPFLNLIFIRADVFVLAKLFSPAELGLYAMAIYLVQTPMSFLMNILGQILLPAFSHVQGNDVRTNRMLLRVTSALVLAGMPALIFFFFCGRSVLTLVYGHPYATASVPLIAAACVAFLNVLNGQITIVFYARGTPQLHRRCVVIMAITVLTLIYPCVMRFGVVGGQLAALAAVGCGLSFQAWRVRNLIGLGLARYGRVFLIAVLLSSAGAFVFLSTHLFASLSRPVANVLLGVLACFIAYGLSITIVLRGNLAEIAGEVTP